MGDGPSVMSVDGALRDPAPGGVMHVLHKTCGCGAGGHQRAERVAGCAAGPVKPLVRPHPTSPMISAVQYRQSGTPQESANDRRHACAKSSEHLFRSEQPRQSPFRQSPIRFMAVSTAAFSTMDSSPQ